MQQIQAIEIAAGGGATTLPAASYHLDGLAMPPRIVLASLVTPTPDVVAEGIAVRFTAGYGSLAADVPHPIRHALLLLVAHWFENREPFIEGAMPKSFPDAVIGLLEPYRVRRL